MTSPSSALEFANNKWLKLNSLQGSSGVLFYESGTSTSTNIQTGARIYYDGAADMLKLTTKDNGIEYNAFGIKRTNGYIGIATSTPYETIQIGDRWTFHNGGTKIMGYNFTYNSGDKRILTDYSTAVKMDPIGIRFSVAASGSAGSSIIWLTPITLSTTYGNISMGGYPGYPVNSIIDYNFSGTNPRISSPSGRISFYNTIGLNVILPKS